MDTTPPTSHVSPLPGRDQLDVSHLGRGRRWRVATGGHLVVQHLFVHQRRPWTLWTTVPANNATANFTGQSDTTYAFYSVAHDLAGNTEVKKPVIEASTYVPDLTAPVTVVDGTSGSNPTSVNASTGTFTLNITGNDPGGSAITYFEVFASVDSGPYTMVNGTAIPAGPADSQGNVHASIFYQGLTDGQSHTYSFYSIGIDGAGNVQRVPALPTSRSPRASPTPLLRSLR